MHKALKLIIISLSAVIVVSGAACFLRARFFGNDANAKNGGEWMRRWKRAAVLQLENKKVIEKTFNVVYDPEQDLPPEWNGDKEYSIFIDFDISYDGLIDNYVIIELSDDAEVISSHRINLFEPMEKIEAQETAAGNGVNRKLRGLYGNVHLEYDKTYRIKAETVFEAKAVEIISCNLSIEKPVL
jgi:hypothetical protein